MLILVVDDDTDDLQLFCDAAREVDPSIKLITARNGEEALSYLLTRAKTFPDFIFMDVNMPRVDGRQCLASIRQHRLTKHLPVIMHTTSLSNMDKSYFDSLNARCLTKASNYSQIVESLRQILAVLKKERDTTIFLR